MSTPSSRPPSPPPPHGALVPLAPHPPWRPIFQADSQVVLYNPHSHALSISTLHGDDHGGEYRDLRLPALCPYCGQAISASAEHHPAAPSARRAPNYFYLLAMANESAASRGGSRPGTPERAGAGERRFFGETLAEGYYESFFREERRLGMGANGSVFLCQHVLDGNPLGHFAVKKIAVGQSHSYLLRTLREVRLLETLRHPNVITYHHAWLESYQFSSFGERVPTLFVLMQFAEGGSLDTLLAARQGIGDDSPSASGKDTQQTHSARIRALRAKKLRQAERGKTAVHLLGVDEIEKLFEDVVEGLNFLHEHSILHLDLKPANVLLTPDDNSPIPRCLLSDFGNSQDMLHLNKERSGETGTLEYMAPEIITPPLIPPTKAADLWSLGMILHSLLFFRLPYSQTKDVDALEREVMAYPGFRITEEISEACERRGVPLHLLKLLEALLNPNPAARPSCETILSMIRVGAVRQRKPRVARRMSDDHHHQGAGTGTLVAKVPPPPEINMRRRILEEVEIEIEAEAEAEEEEEEEGGATIRSEHGSEVSDVPRRRSRASPPRRPPRRIVLNRRDVVRGIKVCSLIAKVVTFPMLCPHVRLDSWRGVVMVGLAASDLLTDSVRVSSVLLGAHVCFVALCSI